MPRIALLSSLVVVMLLGIATLRPHLEARAQDATPAGEDAMMQEGVTFMPIGFADGVDLPSPASLIAVRVSIEPGAVSPFSEEDPAGGMLVVESGTFTARVEAAWSLTRGDENFGESEAIAVGDEATLAVGDVAYIPGSVAGEIRNDGTEPATGLLFLIIPGSLGTPEATPAT
jgi:hypothetical protein